MKIKKILVPVDFSASSDLAVEMALHIAGKSQAELIIHHVNGLPAGGDAMFFINAEIIEKIEQESKEDFERLVERIQGLKSIPHRFIQETGQPIDKIKKLIHTEKPDLVVMGSKGKNRASNIMFGSVASGIINHSEKPVLLIPEGVAAYSFKHILLATDFDKDSHLLSIRFLSELARIFQAKIHVLHVVKDESPVDVSVNPGIVMDWAGAMKDIQHEYHFVSHDDVQKGVTRYAYENGVELLSVLGRSYPFMERLFHKSVSKQLMYHSGLPLLILPS